MFSVKSVSKTSLLMLNPFAFSFEKKFIPTISFGEYLDFSGVSFLPSGFVFIILSTSKSLVFFV